MVRPAGSLGEALVGAPEGPLRSGAAVHVGEELLLGGEEDVRALGQAGHGRGAPNTGDKKTIRCFKCFEYYVGCKRRKCLK